IRAETEEQQRRFLAARREIEAFDYASFLGRESAVSSILLQVRTLPVLAQRRLVTVRGFERLRKDDQTAILGELRREPATCRLVLCSGADDWKLEKLIVKEGCGKFIIALPAAALDEVEQFITRWAERHGLQVPEDARVLLQELTGTSLSQLASELNKLGTALASPERTATPRKITRELVRDLCGQWRTYQVTELLDAVTQRSRSRALSNLRRLAEWNEEPVRITNALASRFLRMLAYPYGDARHWTRPEIAGALSALARIDLALKRGMQERYYLLENFVIRHIAAARRRAEA
ncbi:MAG: DNA polymerase III subunit delta, partial [candidate division WOR-3 bacterium]